MAEILDLPDFRIGEQPDWPLVYKRFMKKTRPVPTFGLEALVKLRAGLHPDQRKAMDQQFNWMVRVVTDDQSGAAGILLPRLDPTYFTRKYNSYGEVTEGPCEAQNLTATDDFFRRWRIPNPTLDQRLLICRSLALGLGKLHRAEVIYGDLSLRNFLFRMEPNVSVMFVDTDAVRPKGGSSPLGKQPHTGDWEPPEAIAAQRSGNKVGFAIQNFETDRYKLGLAILRILARVPRAGETRDPTHVRGLVPSSTYKMLERSLHGRPSERPTAKDWYQEFR
jgi:serine/threonine protein kinase